MRSNKWMSLITNNIVKFKDRINRRKISGLIKVLQETRTFLALPDNNFLWSPWPDANTALAEIDNVITQLETGIIPNKQKFKQELELLFAPTCHIQEVSVSSGWADQFLGLSEKFDYEINKL